jgi:hypothetical protein
MGSCTQPPALYTERLCCCLRVRPHPPYMSHAAGFGRYQVSEILQKPKQETAMGSGMQPLVYTGRLYCCLRALPYLTFISHVDSFG